jgi:hypothetical protein
MPALPIRSNWMSGKRALASLLEHGLRVEIEETGSVFLVDRCFPNRVWSLACWNSTGPHRHKSLIFAAAAARPFRHRAERAISANLLRFRGRVQQLLVRVIFLLGISDCHNPISQVAFLEQIDSRVRSAGF